jgi:hypothetical protein
MNLRWIKGQRPASKASVPNAAIECDGSELCLVLAKLRRQGRTPSEPVKISPNKWRVIPGGTTGDFQSDPYGDKDRDYSFKSFSQGMRGQLDY